MDPCSSGEDLVIKMRKTYTITKQREKWTEEEHTLFLEALKLYGRAWQRIEEHVGTKTAVQIRSHAQKFFTKLEKEAIVKGVGQALDIEIPPPRPKRKPSNPYPRKRGVAASFTQVGVKDCKILNPSSTPFQTKTTMACDKGSEKLCDDVEQRNRDEYCGKDKCFEASPISDAPRKCTFVQYVPLANASDNLISIGESLVGTEAKGHDVEKSDSEQFFQDNVQLSSSMESCLSHVKSSRVQNMKELKQCGNYCKMPITDEQTFPNYPRHVPVHILDGSLSRSAQHLSADKSFTESALFGQIGGIHGDQTPFINPAGPTTSEHNNDVSGSSIHQSSPSYHPFFTPVQITGDYHSFLPMSSAFSSSVLSALTQNAAAFYAAASFATTLWPAQLEPRTVSGGAFQSVVSPSPTMAAIAAATVAAAASWWAAQGLLPYHTGYTCSPVFAPAAQLDGSPIGTINRDNQEQTLDPALEGQPLEPGTSETTCSASKLQSSLSLDSEPIAAEKLNGETSAPGTAEIENPSVLPDSNKSKNKKQLDRSSCGSNTSSSSEVEADAMEKPSVGEEDNHTEKPKSLEGLDSVHPIFDLFSRRCRNSSNINDSWKEVSEGGRLAFQALFSREVLPQSFSPPHDVKKNNGKICTNMLLEDKVDELKLESDGERWITGFRKPEMESNSSLIGLAKNGLEQTKLKSWRTGFKPYKRCSTEARDRVSGNRQEEEKDPKKLRIEGEVYM